MKIPYTWLCELLPELPEKINNNPKNLEPILAMLGTGIEEIVIVPDPPTGVVFGMVQECADIPDTHLKVLKVNVGTAHSTIQTIVTGAANARTGIGVAVATPGTRVGGLEIGVRNVHGTTSWGMCCSPKELGLGEYGAGLLELPANDAAPGTAFATLWPGETILDIEITPNRADALSVLGIARDLAAKLEIELHEPPRGEQSTAQDDYPVRVELRSKDCDRFVARLARGVRVGPSPAWLQRRVNNAGMRAINNLVDASNVVMLELGQPTAAYDVKDVPNLTLVVRDGQPSENVLGLNDNTYTVDANDLIVATDVQGESRAVGIGGILGAMYSSIQPDTQDVILEAAHWDAVRLRLTGRKHGLKTDALYHFERGVDPNLPVWAADRYMDIVAKIAGGTIVPGHRDVGGEKARGTVLFRPKECNRYLGTNYEHQAMHSALTRLGFDILEQTENPNDHWVVRPPTQRVNMDLEEDIIEEVARLLGYDAIPATLPAFVNNDAARNADEHVRQHRALKDVLVGLGFQEVVTYTFCNPEDSAKLQAPTPVLALRNPQSAERTHLRASLYQSLLGVAHTNRQAPGLLLCEIGQVFPSATQEETRLALLLSGAHAPKNWQNGVGGGFYALKGLLEASANRLGATLDVLPQHNPMPQLHPGIAGDVIWNGVSIGWIGALHPSIQHNLELQPTVVAELRLPLPKRTWNFNDPSRQPAALRDLAIIAPQHVGFAELASIVRTAAGQNFEDLEPFDVYAGHPIAAGKRSVALRIAWRDAERTLNEAEIDAAFRSVIDAVKHAGFEIRDQ